ncbi:MAG: hypothetical protein ABEI98_10415 [Halorhabdus sp.]
MDGTVGPATGEARERVISTVEDSHEYETLYRYFTERGYEAGERRVVDDGESYIVDIVFESEEPRVSAEATLILRRPNYELEVYDATGYVEYEDETGEIVEVETVPYEHGGIGEVERTSVE